MNPLRFRPKASGGGGWEELCGLGGAGSVGMVTSRSLLMNFILESELGPVFAHLFQQSIDTGEIRKKWSLANICPLFKKGDRSLACNYRSVSLTCVPCKLLGHIGCSNIMAHLDEHKLLPDRQHAFRKRHSCETQLITVINDWAKILDDCGQVDTFILDFEKAFDTPLMSYLNASCMVMVLVERLWNGYILFSVSGSSEL